MIIKQIFSKTARVAVPLLLSLSFIGLATASELVYKPVNPNFGGNPFNGNPLLGSANAQDQFSNAPAPVPDFSGLERALIRLGEQTTAVPDTTTTTEVAP